MDAQEWQNIQEAFVWLYAPWINLGLGLFVGFSILTAISRMFVHFSRWLTKA